MIAIFTNDGDGYEEIIAIVSDKKYVSDYIKEYTGFEDKGYIVKNDEYWCKTFNKDKEGILIKTEI